MICPSECAGIDSTGGLAEQASHRQFGPLNACIVTSNSARHSSTSPFMTAFPWQLFSGSMSVRASSKWGMFPQDLGLRSVPQFYSSCCCHIVLHHWLVTAHTKSKFCKLRLITMTFCRPTMHNSTKGHWVHTSSYAYHVANLSRC